MQCYATHVRKNALSECRRKFGELKDLFVLRPIFDAHSIETISLTLEFSGDVDQLGLSVVRDEASRLKVKLPIRRIMRKNSPPSHDSQGTNSEVKGYLFLDKISEKENN